MKIEITYKAGTVDKYLIKESDAPKILEHHLNNKNVEEVRFRRMNNSSKQQNIRQSNEEKDTE